MALSHRETFSGVKIINGAWLADISEAVTSADISLSCSEVSQLTLTVDDPQYGFFRKHKIPLKTWIEYDKMRFSVAAISTHEGGGEGGFTLTCRPRIVRALKERKGKKTMKNVSPSTFIINECKAVGAKMTIQPSAKRSSVSRDVTQSGQQDSSEEQNSWTTFTRLAEELGYLCFEQEGRIFFGQPTWLAARSNVYRVTFGDPNSGYETTAIPECDRSLDNDGKITISFSVPVERQKDFRPGRVVDFRGVPTFDGKYFITTVDFPLAGSGEVTITAETPTNPRVDKK